MVGPSGCTEEGSVEVTRGTDRITAERERQLTEEGWTAERDHKYRWGILAMAGAAYALPGYLREQHILERTIRQIIWPWDEEWWKPDHHTTGGNVAEGRVRELEKAGALIAAEIDKILDEEDRIKAQTEALSQAEERGR